MKNLSIMILTTVLLMGCNKNSIINHSDTANEIISTNEITTYLTHRDIIDIKGFTATSDEIAICEQQGGKIEKVGMSQADACVVVFADKDKVCTDNDQCQSGSCLTDTDIEMNKKATGQCARTNNSFGCTNHVVNGKALGTICVD